MPVDLVLTPGVMVSAMCVRERLFSHGSSSVRRKQVSEDMKRKNVPLFITCLEEERASRHISGTVNKGGEDRIRYKGEGGGPEKGEEVEGVTGEKKHGDLKV